MKERNSFRAILAVLATLTALATSVAPAIAWTGAAGQIGIVQSWNGHTEILDVEGSDDMETVRRSFYDKTGIDPADTCLIFEGTLMQDGRTLIDYGVDVNDDLDLFLLPVSAAWSITPDEHFVGNTVHNVPVTNPHGTHFAVVNGALPAGVTLDADTGIVDGKFTSPDPFDVTIRVTTLCGDADITWASSGGKALPDTGSTDAALFGGIGCASLLAMVGAAIVVIRRPRTRRN